MASRKDKTAKASRNSAPTWRYLGALGMFTLLIMSVIFGLQQLDQFLIRDARFMLAPPLEYGEESPNLHIEGIRYASRRQVLRIFQPDIDRSIYLLPLQERRMALKRLAWVKDATVRRTWPNEVSVQIVERQPVAFVQLPSEAITRWALIDADGVILDPPGKAPFKLPVATGIRSDETLEMRSLRVRRMRKMLDELGPLRDKLSDVDVSDLDDLKVTAKMDNRIVILRMGDHNFKNRFQSFLDNYEEIEKHNPEMHMLDLRLDDRITVLGGKHGAR